MTPGGLPSAGVSGQTTGMDSGLALALQTLLAQSQTTAADVSAMRSDEEWRHDIETRVRVLEARPSGADVGGRLAALERFRYTVAGLAVAGGILAGWVGQYIAVHVH